MPELTRRSFIVMLAALVAASRAVNAIDPKPAITVRDLGIRWTADANGNLYLAYMTEFTLDGKQYYSKTDRELADTQDDINQFRLCEDNAFLEGLMHQYKTGALV